MSASNNDSINSTSLSSTSSSFLIPRNIQFWLFLFSNILSLLCCLFVLFHLLSDRILRHALHNHVIIVVLLLTLIAELTDVPWILYFYQWGIVWQSTRTFCLVWKYIDITVYVATSKLVAWVSIERHILIFHGTWVSTKKKRLFVHYTPLVAVVGYCIIYYAFSLCVVPCVNPFSYDAFFCGYSLCTPPSIIVSLYEFISGGILCSLITVLFSIGLIVRVVRQKRRVNQPIQWRKHRKLTIQLLFITSLFDFIYLPPVVLAVARLLGMPANIGAGYSVFVAQFLSYYITFLFPFACIISLPQLRTRVKNTIRWFWRRQTRAVGP
jgi:hypothetical protein